MFSKIIWYSTGFDADTIFDFEKLTVMIYRNLNKSFSFLARLIFLSAHKAKSRFFCGSWFASVSRLSIFPAVRLDRLPEIIQPMRLNVRSQFPEDDNNEKMKIEKEVRVRQKRCGFYYQVRVPRRCGYGAGAGVTCSTFFSILLEISEKSEKNQKNHFFRKMKKCLFFCFLF